MIKLTVGQIADSLCDWARGGKKLLILSHRSPDGDTLGSAFALKLIYEAMGGTAFCGCQGEAAPYLRFLYAGQESITVTEEIQAVYDIIICVDVASPQQLGTLEPLAAKTSLMIDHHSAGEPFAACCIDPEAAAAGELVFRIYEELLGKTGSLPQVCERLYAALSADTGSFKYSNTTEKTHVIAGKLISELRSAGIDHSEISRRLHDSLSLADLKARQIIAKNLKVACGGALAYVMLTASELRDEGLSEENTGSAVDIPRSIEGVQLAFAVKQSFDNENEYRISARANGDIDVAELCGKFGGGGHKKAAGGRLTADSPKAAIVAVLEVFSAALDSVAEETERL